MSDLDDARSALSEAGRPDLAETLGHLVGGVACFDQALTDDDRAFVSPILAPMLTPIDPTPWRGQLDEVVVYAHDDRIVYAPRNSVDTWDDLSGRTSPHPSVGVREPPE